MRDSGAYRTLRPSLSLRQSRSLSPERLVLWSHLSNGCQSSFLYWRWKDHTNCSWHDMAGVKWQWVSCQAGTGPSPESGQRCLVSVSLIMLTSCCHVAGRYSEWSAGWMTGAQTCSTSLRLSRDIEDLPHHRRWIDGYFSPFIWCVKKTTFIRLY